MPRNYAPYRDGTEALTAIEHGSAYSVTLTKSPHNPTGDPRYTVFDLDPSSCTVTFDEAWSVHIQARLTLEATTDPNLLAALNPLYPATVVIKAGYIWPDGSTDLQTLATLFVRSRQISEPAGTLSVHLVSWEGLIEDYTYIRPHTPRTVNLVSWLTDHLKTTLTPVTPPTVSNRSGVYAGGGVGLIAGMTYPLGRTAGGSLTDVAARCSKWVHADSLGRCVIDARPVKATDPEAMAATLSKGPGGTVTRMDTWSDREPWYNTVVLRYWWDNGTASQNIIGTARPFMSVLGPQFAGERAYYEEINAGATQAAADAAAVSKLTHLLGRHRIHDVTAVAAYWIRPGQTVQLQPLDGPDETAQVRTVTFDLSTHSMTLATRETIPTDQVQPWPMVTW